MSFQSRDRHVMPWAPFCVQVTLTWWEFPLVFSHIRENALLLGVRVQYSKRERLSYVQISERRRQAPDMGVQSPPRKLGSERHQFVSVRGEASDGLVLMCTLILLAVRLILTTRSSRNFQMDRRSSNGLPCHRSSPTSFFPPPGPGSLHESGDYVPKAFVRIIRMPSPRTWTLDRSRKVR